MEEIWLKKYGYSNYQISNYGSIKNMKGKVLKGRINEHGYHIVMMINDSGISKNHRIHRLVAELFVQNKNNKPQVNHINGIKTDNFYLNLEWCTGSENMKHASINKMLHLNYGKSKAINKYDLDFNFIETFESVALASISVGRNGKDISLCCYNNKTCGGFKWRYSEMIFDKTSKNENLPKPVIQKDLSGNIINVFESISKAYNSTGIQIKSIRQTCNGIQRTAGNYKWEWK